MYFFFEDGELRDGRRGLRIVRVGTHAVSGVSRTTLWNRLAQHKGVAGGSLPGGGNHRGSIFRLHVGTALLDRGDYPDVIRQTWGRGSSAGAEVRAAEYPLERDVSTYIGTLPFLWLAVPDPAGPGSDRRRIEAGAIGLLSNYRRPAIDPPSPGWLGRRADRAAIRESGLWNIDYVDGRHDPAFLDLLAQYVRRT